MEETEKMAALKRAYAEIILNTAKESAARILVSERRAVQNQQSVVVVKEEALATLLRLKSIMDSKIKEAEKASLGQATRIQELEVQLSEAKDTINCLRTELERVNSKLERMKNNLTEPLSRQNTSDHAKSEESKHSSDLTPSSPVGPLHGSISDLEHSTGSQGTAVGKCCIIENATEAVVLKELSPENEIASNPDLASIIMRSKEPELYRSGCTQRIRALEQKLLTGRIPLVKIDDKCSNFKKELTICEKRKAEDPCTADSANTNKVEVQTESPCESKATVQQANSCENGQIKFFSRVPSRRMIKCKNMTSISCDTPDQDMANHGPSEICCTKISGHHNVMESGDNLCRAVNEETQRTSSSCFTSLLTGNCINPVGRKVCMGMSLRDEVSGFLHGNKIEITRLTANRKIHPESGSEIFRSPALSTGGVEHDNRLIGLTDVKDVLLTGGDQNDTSDTVQVEDSILVIPAQKIAENLDVYACEMKPPVKNEVLLMKNDSKDEKICGTSEASAQAGGDRFLKYTFRRKRKRGSSGIHDEVALPEKSSTSKRRTVDKHNALPEPQKPSLIRESSRDSRRMAQVARQLISLSEKRWW